MLLFRGEKRAILINTFIHNTESINFTFAHELGHHFLQHSPTYFSNGQQGFRCTPEDQFYLSMVSTVLDYTIISNLARQFYVSKHACCNRLLEFTKDPCIVIRSQGHLITEIRASSAARHKLPALKQILLGTAAYEAITTKRNQNAFEASDSAKWHLNPNSSIQLYEWTRGDWEHSVAMTILRW